MDSIYNKLLTRTPLIYSKTLSNLFDNNIFLKLESCQDSGSFKFRGALNGVINILSNLELDIQNISSEILEDIKNLENINSLSNDVESQSNNLKIAPGKNPMNKKYSHISTYTTGNHGIALAKLSSIFKFNLKIFAPKYIAQNKIHAIKKYETDLILTSNRHDAEYYAKNSSGGYFLSPSDNNNVLEGISTIVSEIIEQLSSNEIHAIFAPCGGGGLLSGIYKGLEAANLNNKTKVFGCEPEVANDAYISRSNGSIFKFTNSPNTSADALKALSLSSTTFQYIKKIDDMFLISESKIDESFDKMRSIMAEIDLKVNKSIEISSSIVFDGLRQWGKINPDIKGKNIILIVSGGNI